MSKLFFTLLLFVSLLVAAPNFAHAAYTKTIMADPIELLGWNRLFVRYETMVAKNNSFVAMAGFTSYYTDAIGLFLGAEYRWYLRDVFPAKTAGIEGFSLGPWAEVGMYRYDGLYDDYNDFSFAIGGEAAYKWVFGGFSVEPNFSLGFNMTKASYVNTASWGIGVNLGYAW